MVLLTCYNRREMTLSCLRSLEENKKDFGEIMGEELRLRYIITDDASTDHTEEALRSLGADITILKGNGNLFWCGGMRKSMNYAAKMLNNGSENADYVMLVNDDVTFFHNALRKLVERQKSSNCDVVVGATSDAKGELTYGGVRKTSRFFAKFEEIGPSQEPVLCDTFHCNCVLMTRETFLFSGNLDKHFVHSMGDYDYGMRMYKAGRIVINTRGYVGVCEKNPVEGSWLDSTLPRLERLKKKESMKGLPRKDWYHFVRKNYGLFPAVYHFVTPYIRILLGI